MTTKAFMTDEELLSLPKDGYKYELIDGELVKSPGTMLRGKIAAHLGYLIGKYLDQVPLAEVYGSSAGYRMVSGNLLSPDLSVVLSTRFQVVSNPKASATSRRILQSKCFRHANGRKS